MQSIVYGGPHAVVIAETGQLATPGVPVDIDDDDLAERLLAQDVWTRPRARRSTPTVDAAGIAPTAAEPGQED